MGMNLRARPWEANGDRLSGMSDAGNIIDYFYSIITISNLTLSSRCSNAAQLQKEGNYQNGSRWQENLSCSHRGRPLAIYYMLSPINPKRCIIIVLPAYNEAETIEHLLDRIAEVMPEFSFTYQIVIVDDGSQDSTTAVVERKIADIPIILEKHETNLGLGSTIRDGLLIAADRAADMDIIVTMDADDTHSPGLILRMVRMIYEGYDVVIASRYQHGSRSVGVPLSRKFLSYAASWIFRVTFPISGVKDYTSGYRAYNAKVIKAAISQYGQQFVDEDGFQCMVDILLKLRKMHVIFGEVPFLLRYDRKVGKSKMKVARTIKNTLILLAKRRLG